MRLLLICLSLALLSAGASTADANPQSKVATLFEQDVAAFDFARVKLEADRIVDPSLNIEAELAKIDEMVTIIEGAIYADADDRSKMEAIRHFLYRPGWWNEDRPFSYDHNDPFGQDPRNRLLSNYLDDRRGNCVTMPFLMIILGQRLGLDMVPALAPIHVLVKFTDDAGVTHNLEATSGGGIARDAHYRENMPITDHAVEVGTYLRPLSQDESIAVIATVVVEHLIRDQQYREAIDVSNILLSHYPDYAYMLTKRGTAAYYLLKENFYDKYPTTQDVPQAERALLAYWQRINKVSFDHADRIGWMPMQLTRPLPAVWSE